MTCPLGGAKWGLLCGWHWDSNGTMQAVSSRKKTKSNRKCLDLYHLHCYHVEAFCYDMLDGEKVQAGAGY